MENYFKIKVLKIGILGNYLRMIFFFKLNLKIEILKNYLKMEVLKIKFENWNFKNYLKTRVSKIKFENWDFEKLFKKKSFVN